MKPVKVRRGQKIYTSKKPKIKGVLKIFGAIIISVGLIIGGFFIAEPLLSLFISNDVTVPDIGVDDDATVPDNGADDNDASDDLVVTDSDISGTVLTTTQLSDLTTLETTFAELVAEGVNTVVVPLKDDTGTVLYNSAVELAVNSGAVSDTSYNLSQVVALANSYGLDVIGSLAAFKDPISSYYDKTTAVLYNETSSTWLDDSAENGGQSWLNPHNDDARAYIVNLATEAVDAGVSGITLTNVQFPDVYYAEFQTMYNEADGVTHEDAMLSFITLVREAVGTDIYLSVYLTAGDGITTSFSYPYLASDIEDADVAIYLDLNSVTVTDDTGATVTDISSNLELFITAALADYDTDGITVIISSQWDVDSQKSILESMGIANIIEQ